MDFYAEAEQLKDKDFKQIIGVEKVTFDAKENGILEKRKGTR